MFVCLLFCTLYMHVHTHNLIYSHICILFLLLLGNAMNSTCERLCASLFKNKYKKQNTNTRKCTKNQLNDQQTKGILCLWRDQPERKRERAAATLRLLLPSPSPAVVDSSIGAQITKAAKIKNTQNCSSNGEEKFLRVHWHHWGNRFPIPSPANVEFIYQLKYFANKLQSMTLRRSLSLSLPLSLRKHIHAHAHRVQCSGCALSPTVCAWAAERERESGAKRARQQVTQAC